MKKNSLKSTRYQAKVIFFTLAAVSLFATGCQKNIDSSETQKPIIHSTNMPLQYPSMNYLDIEAVDTSSKDAPDNEEYIQSLMEIANDNYNNKSYAKALRAANQILKFNQNSLQAKQLAALSSIKIAESNMGFFKGLGINEDQKKDIKNSIAYMDSVITKNEK